MFLRHLLNGDWVFDGLVDGDFVPDGFGGWTQYDSSIRNRRPSVKYVRFNPYGVSVSRVFDGTDENSVFKEFKDSVDELKRFIDANKKLEHNKHDVRHEKNESSYTNCGQCHKHDFQNGEKVCTDHVPAESCKSDDQKKEPTSRKITVELDPEEVNALKTVLSSETLRSIIKATESGM